MQCCLVIIFNHRYDQNIPKLKRLYGTRFPLLRFLVPFYDGDDPSVVPVYENSSCFQGYIAQAYSQLAQIDCSHYLFCGDDVLMHPCFSAVTIAERLGLDDRTAFFPNLAPLCEADTRWDPMIDGWIAFKSERHVSYSSVLPAYDEAEARFVAHHGLVMRRLHLRQVLRPPFWTPMSLIRHLIRIAPVCGQVLCERRFPYPLAYGLSDFFLLPRVHGHEFARICGVFSAMRLFVEIAIPTALLLTCPQLHIGSRQGWTYTALWTDSERKQLHEQYRGSIRNLESAFTEWSLFVHPTKLSQWMVE